MLPPFLKLGIVSYNHNNREIETALCFEKMWDAKQKLYSSSTVIANSALLVTRNRKCFGDFFNTCNYIRAVPCIKSHLLDRKPQTLPIAFILHT